MIDCINESQLKNFLWTDPGWFIYQLEVRIWFWSSAARPPTSCTWALPLCILFLFGELIPSPPLPPRPRSLIGEFTVYKELINWIKLFIVFYTYLLFLWVLLFSAFLVFFGSMCARSKKCIFIWLSIYLPHALIVVCTSTLVKIMLWSKIAAHECRQRFHPTTFRNF